MHSASCDVRANLADQWYRVASSCVGLNRNAATGQKYELTHKQVRALAEFSYEHCDPNVSTLLLLDAGDELLDYRVAEAWYRGCGKTEVYAQGGH